MKKRIRKSFVRIRKTYRILLKQGKAVKSGSTAEWLLDNYYIFAEEFSTLRGLRLSRFEKRIFRSLLSFAETFLEAENYRLSEASLYAALTASGKMHASVSLRLLPSALAASLFSRAAFLCKKPQEAGLFGNIVRSLLTLRELDMDALYQNHCGVDAALSKDAAFLDMTPSSKALYRKAAEGLARRIGKTDAFVAQEAARLSEGESGIRSSAGYYLLGAGIDSLYTRLSIPPRKKVRRDLFYIGSVLFLTFLSAGYIFLLTEKMLLTLFAVFPLMEIFVQLLTYFLQKATPATALPRLALKDGIPEKIAVIYPTLISSPKKAEEMAEKLEICYLANREENLFFGLLADFKDTAERFEDPDIPKTLSRVITALNEKYGNRFFMVCREQSFAPRQGKWMGKERKRGALSDFNLFLRNRYTFRYGAGCIDSLSGIRHVITLDDDTLLPPGAAKKLIGTALHPLCRPHIKDGRVLSGYGIIQPRISLRLESAGRTLFSRIFAGPGGMDTYQSSVSEFYMDVFGSSTFTGKGIYHVDAFLSCLSFPEDAVLSHDLLEGSFIRCGLASDIQVFDAFPARLSDYTLRQKRWIRGDWQTLPWLFGRIPTKTGEKIKTTLSPLSRWKIFDNLRRSLLPIFYLILFLGGNPTGELVAFVSILTPLFLVLSDALLCRRFSFSEKRQANIIGGTLSALYRATLSIAFLSHFSIAAFSSAALGLWRSFTRRHSLEWVTAADAEASAADAMGAAFRTMLPSVLLGLSLFLTCLSGMFALGGLQFLLSLLWIFSPFLSFIIGRESGADVYTLSPKSEARLRETALRTWNFFRDTMTQADHFLPPDNLQVKPYRGIAHRTSPTNIGLGLLAPLCACELGLIGREEAVSRITELMETIEKLPTWQGHLYNWYDTRTLKPLPPRYVSTVDSGNFACYLLTAAMGLREYAGGDTPLTKRMCLFAEQINFRPLYNEKKKLFAVGFSPEENRLSTAYYDLLISEARQAGFLAIALCQVPPEHWFTLGRGLVASDGYRGLVSWSGTMFEYFMPLLIMRKYENSLLSETYRFALSCQKRTGRRRRIPWGVSESGFYAFDNDGNYQYKAFGISELGLSRQSEEDIVIAPYASLLALMEDPKSALSNMERMRHEGLYGEYGFFEAADYTPARLMGNMRRGIVKSYMAHHQGMSLAAMTNLLSKNVLQRWFHAYAPVRAAEILLKEQLPIGAPVLKDRHAPTPPVRFRWQASSRTVREYERANTYPRPLQLLSGGSYHLFIDTHGHGQSRLLGVSLNAFSPIEGGGTAVWIVNPLTGEVTDGYGTSCVFHENRADFSGKSGPLSTHLSVTVCGEDTCEMRRLTLRNTSEKERTYEVYFYTEPILAVPKAHQAHPAFSRLFITTSEEQGVLFAERRVRTETEKTFLGFAAAFLDGEAATQFDTDRLSFFGRGNALPQSLVPGHLLAKKIGTTLDPCFAIKLRITMQPGESKTAVFLAGLCENKARAFQMVNTYKGGLLPPAEAASPFHFKENEEAHFMQIAAFSIYGGAKGEKLLEARERNTRPAEDLWKLGISGDNPILFLRLCDTGEAPLLEEGCKAHAFLKSYGIRIDLVIFCDEPGGYTRPVFQMAEKKRTDGIFVFGRRELAEGDLRLLSAIAFLYIDSASGGFASLPPFTSQPKALKPDFKGEDGPLPPVSLLLDNGLGGFDAESGDYVITLRGEERTPLPWTQVIANEDFGFITDERGSGYTYSGNSQSFRLTPWFCDSVHAPLSEWLTVEEAEDIWSPMAGVFREKGTYRIRFGPGYAVYMRNTRGLMHTATVFVHPEKAQKCILLSVENQSDRKRTLTASYALLPALGTHCEPDKLDIEIQKNKLSIRNVFSKVQKKVSLCGFGETTYGQHGHHVYARTAKTLLPGKSATFEFTLSTEDSPVCPDRELLSAAKAYWQKQLDTLTVETGDKGVDFMLNRWLPYQATACRLFARTAFYQSGGAFGFRDQLQDALALIDTAPHLVRRQILLHAAHQFEEGDVFHWWHTDGTGVRTRFSDDRLFLPFVAAIYAEETGDSTIWDAEESFVIEPPLAPEETERYTFIKARTAPFPLYEHAVRAIEISLSKGVHDLPLMGGGDWNDGMNTVGIGMAGESVWLAWFLKVTLDKFIPVCEARGDAARAARYRAEALCLLEAAERTYDGTHYARAYFDDGTPLGTANNAECSIDAISQAWAVMAGAKHSHAKTAMESVEKNLISYDTGIIKLLAPPFKSSTPSPGYIQSYPEGLRENGGQYTHGAIWVVMAYALLGNAEKAWSLFRMLCPPYHAETPGEMHKYKVEPYVMAADVYAAPTHEGRGGWTWYTGAAAWMYRLGIRYLIGFKRQGASVSFSPCMPIPKEGLTVTYRFGSATYRFHVFGSGGPYPLVDDGKAHTLIVENKKGMQGS